MQAAHGDGLRALLSSYVRPFLPSPRSQLELIRFQLRKTVPFKIEEAHIDYQIFPSPAEGEGYSCLATLVLQPILSQYEAGCAIWASTPVLST